MPEHNLFRIFVSRLNKLSIPYMITGAVASIIYGKPQKILRFKFDLAAKKRKKHKNKFSGFVISMCYNEQKSKF